jgi:predicted nucleotidyltransferase
MDFYHARQEFLSKKVKHAFSGYAFAQLKRIKSHRSYLMSPPKEKPERKNYGLSERKMLSSDSIGAIQWLFSKFLENSIEELSFSDSTKDELRNINFIGLTQSNLSRDLSEDSWKVIQQGANVSDEVIHVMMQEKAYGNALNEWTSYENWKKSRNPKRAALEEKYGYDCKHAMHLVRLMRMGIEILETSNLSVFRPDREELLRIRSGLWTFDQVVDYANESEQKMNSLYNTTKLPHSSNKVFLDCLCQKAVERYIDAK